MRYHPVLPEIISAMPSYHTVSLHSIIQCHRSLPHSNVHRFTLETLRVIFNFVSCVFVFEFYAGLTLAFILYRKTQGFVYPSFSLCCACHDVVRVIFFASRFAVPEQSRALSQHAKKHVILCGSVGQESRAVTVCVNKTYDTNGYNRL